jgi:hypothetical protein
MYSPKIREDLIPKIYRAAKGAKVAMTEWVNRAIEQALPKDESTEDPEASERHLRRENENE